VWSKRSTLFSVAIALLAVAAVAARAAAHPTGQGTAKKGGELVVQFPTAALDLDPSTSQDNNVAMPLWNAWFEYLIQQQPGGGAFSPMLASAWTISKNGLVYTFHLRKGVRFSNGKTMTSKDVVFSLKRNMQPNISLLHFLLAKIASVQAVGSGTVKITLKQRWPALLADLASPNGAIYPAGSVTKATAKKYFFTHPIGTGPFVLTSTVPNSSYVVTANPYYWDKKHGPRASKITFQVVTDDTAQANAVRGGRADVATSPPPSLLASMKNNPSVKVVSVPSAIVELIALNTKKPPFNNQKIRQAVSLAIDRNAIIKSGLFGYAKPATTFLVGPPKATFQNRSLNLYPYDVAKAKHLMQQSGVKTPITIPFEVSTGTAQDAILNVVQSNLAAIGINVKAVRKDAASVDNDIIGEKYTMNTTFWGDISGDPSIQPEFAIDPKYCCDAYFTGYHDPALIALTHKAIVTPNHAKAQQLFDEMQRRVADAAFLLPLYYPDLIYLTSNRVTRFKVSPYNLYDWKSIGAS
jgi:peptide/nickel transport system substrate-binding protein